MKGYYKKSIAVLTKLNTKLPNVTLGKHLYTALNENELENLSDKELFFKLNDYLSTLESDVPHNEDVEQIIKDGLNLNNILEEE
jgi:hypothetical protein